MGQYWDLQSLGLTSINAQSNSMKTRAEILTSEFKYLPIVGEKKNKQIINV